MTLGDVISAYRKEHKLSMEKFGELAGMSKAYVSMLERNRTQRGDEPSPSFEMYRNVAKALGMDVDALIRQVDGNVSFDATTDTTTNAKSIGEPIDFSKYKRIPILGRIPAGLPLLAEENIEGYTLTDLNGGAEYFALRVTGDSMNAVGIQEGHILQIRKQPEVENGEIAVVMVGDEDATVKRFYSTGTTVTLMPQSTNPIHQPQIYDTKKTHIEVLGKVVKAEFFF